MNQANQTIYKLLKQQINDLLTPEFTQKCQFGKYSQWILYNPVLTADDIIYIISAIGVYGKEGIDIPDIDTRPMFYREGLEEIAGITIPLNAAQQKALHFLGYCYLGAYRYDTFSPFTYSKSACDFSENVQWAMNLTSSDLFGILWHVGGFGWRSPRINKNSINEYYSRAQECLICLMRVAQSKPTYYQYGGIRYPLRESSVNPSELLPFY